MRPIWRFHSRSHKKKDSKAAAVTAETFNLESNFLPFYLQLFFHEKRRQEKDIAAIIAREKRGLPRYLFYTYVYSGNVTKCQNRYIESLFDCISLIEVYIE